MTTAAWPGSLPQSLQLAGQTETLAETTISSQPDMGPRMVRRRFSFMPRRVVGSVAPLTFAQKTALREFYEETLAGGALIFTWSMPDDTDPPDYFMFSAPPVFERITGAAWRARLELEAYKLP